MSSSSSVRNRGSNRGVMNHLRSSCHFGDLVGRWTSWIPLNFGRMFIGCPNYQDELKDCKNFHWVVPPLPNRWYASLLLEFQNKVNLENNAIFGIMDNNKFRGNFLEALLNN